MARPEEATEPQVVRLASIVGRLQERWALIGELAETATRLAGFDVIVVAGEQAVLERLTEVLARARDLLAELATGTGGDATMDALEALLDPERWSVLDEVRRLLGEKDQVVEQARDEVQRRLAVWSEIARRVESADLEVQRHQLYVIEPRELATSRMRLSALVRQANNGLRENRLLDVWRALDELEAPPPAPGGSASPVPLDEVPDRLLALIGQSSSLGALQLMVLRGPLDAENIEYTLMMRTPTGYRRAGVNVQDRSTIGRGSRERFLSAAHAVSAGSYRMLRDAQAVADDEAEEEDRVEGLRSMGQILYRMMIPNRMRDEIDRHPRAPIVITTNDRELSWELMFGESFLALDRPLARMPVGRSGARRTLPVKRRSHRRRVALVASAGAAGELPSAVREVDKIAEGLTRAWGDDVMVDRYVTGTGEPADGARFEQLLISPDYDIIHYAGHAVFDADRPELSGLVLDGPETCSAENIQRLLCGTPLVFLNACETARLRERGDPPPPEGTYEGDPKEGLASAFLYGGALACIGNMWPVLDAVAADFAVAFYTAALRELSLGEAVQIARQRTAARYPRDPSWASFVLYGEPGFSLSTFDSAVAR